MDHRVAAAMRCKLLTGSYEGRVNDCDCPCPNDCHLTRVERDILRMHPRIKAKAKAEWESYHASGTSEQAEAD